ncbi:lipoyl(octanoyl) transferase LipB [Haematospirillum jordaniae]|uniref:Octanoyltransferase n=1 Tax=Haematospirillum jordaniae TaxID=1549855 RepID=A0A143DBI5_9PROT|nr:lipoyl(octanoyl) transferase LipB [Haematospirillum jordaniae]AMW33949.1 lipoate-protein ligase B [Haematospirillum jordaniae]NKD44405.1 lipoyl(octanoyl) transferase LipB [Haematospirillum jordaniae]NKD57425.1 lipoyl(octanoyl) transferase LipB [Haematospirillum jordaniae]NKD59877.1 lipoyl(octanoyl) transferase LipB [Haematospirillum jordaniae]NKD67744.1 lipoyl(octanoyl) transferase LipB [Haematospirillum jordaniae]
MFSPAPEWWLSDTSVPYPDAVATMEERVSAISTGHARELIWLLEHPPLYTAGTSARAEELLRPDTFPVYETGRGGHYTYHGPGQRVGYVMLDLKQRTQDIRCYVHALEEWLIQTLRALDINGERRIDRVGIWIDRGKGREDKIAAIGVRVKRWVTLHGFALNIAPDLTHFQGIIPCGISNHGVTSLQDLGISISIKDMDTLLQQTFEAVFGAQATGPMQKRLPVPPETQA